MPQAQAILSLTRLPACMGLIRLSFGLSLLPQCCDLIDGDDLERPRQPISATPHGGETHIL